MNKTKAYIVVLLLNLCFIAVQAHATVQYTLRPVASFGVGKDANSVGGITRDILEKKKDPLAYAASSPQDLVMNDDHNLLADTENNRVLVFDREGKVHKVINKCGEDAIKTPYRIASYNDNVVIGENATGKLHVYTKERCKTINLYDLNIHSNYEVSMDASNIKIFFDDQIVKVINFDGTVLNTYENNYDDFFMHNNVIGIQFTYKELQKLLQSHKYKLITLLYSDSKGLIYAVGKKDKKIFLLVISSGSISAALNTNMDNYYIYRWNVSRNGNIYGIGRNNNSHKNFIKIFKLMTNGKIN